MIVILILIVLFIAQGVYRNWGRKTFDALPEHIDEAHEWDGKDDDDHWWTSWRKRVKGWFAFGPLSHYAWAKFRRVPRTLIAFKGDGFWRFEQDIGPTDVGGGAWRWFSSFLEPFRQFYSRDTEWYLSRVQYHCEWHLALHWPLFFCFHFSKWQGYIGFKRDADKVYWLSLYFGEKWK